MDYGKMPTTTIQTPLQIGPRLLKNRLVALPVFTGYANPDGSVSSLLLKHYTRLAASGVSMVVVANVAVSPDGVTSRYNLRIDEDRYIPGLKDLGSAIKRQGALACIQLNHAGRFAKTDQPLLVSPVDASNIGYHVASLKGFMHSFPFEKRFGLTRFFLKQIAGWRRAMTRDEMDAVINNFYQAAERAHQSGFDMIEVHGANGYLLCEFLSPATNKRPSGFGGTFENRAVFPLTVVREIRRHVPPSVPLGFRLLLNEWVPEGIELKEAIALARLLERTGISYLSAAAGNFNSIFSTSVVKKMERLAYLREDMIQLTGQVNIPTIISGRVATPSLANELLKQKLAHMVGLGRPLRVDPDWVKKAHHRSSSIKRCLNCNWCLKSVILEQGFVCQRWPQTARLKIYLDRMLLTRNCNGLWVIADGDDLALFKESMPDLLPMSQRSKWKHAIKVLFIEPHDRERFPAKDGTDFLTWLQRLTDNAGSHSETVTVVDKMVHGNWDKAILTELKKQNHGMVLIGRNRSQPWRERLFYLLRHKIIGLISSNSKLRNVAVCLDFSDASLLVLAFVRQAFMNRPGVRLTFFHALDGRKAGTEQRWSRLKRVTGLNPDEPLTRIVSRENAGTAILKEVVSGRYGTIIMGKRGLTGIKRLFLGSVSRAVLQKVDTQTLFLVD
jgi:2,4-dienoyl-CoA reductase-like NADH-dependent reductase (Old Yellow Enzyme family)/nucleotide-binding universal stress UspA family protein